MRREKQIVIEEENRDKGKVFLITEMSAWAADRWAMRALTALAQSGVPVPANVLADGWLAVVQFGLQGILQAKTSDMEALSDEIMACVKMQPDPRNPQVLISMAEFREQIEEVSTLLRLRMEVFEIHTGFSIAAALRERAAAMAAEAADTSDTPTSPTPAAQ